MAQVIALAGSGARPRTERDRLRRNEHGCGRIEHVRNTARSVWCGQFRLSQALLLPRLTSGRSRRADKWGADHPGRVRHRDAAAPGPRSPLVAGEPQTGRHRAQRRGHQDRGATYGVPDVTVAFVSPLLEGRPCLAARASAAGAQSTSTGRLTVAIPPRPKKALTPAAARVAAIKNHQPRW